MPDGYENSPVALNSLPWLVVQQSLLPQSGALFILAIVLIAGLAGGAVARLLKLPRLTTANNATLASDFKPLSNCLPKAKDVNTVHTVGGWRQHYGR